MCSTGITAPNSTTFDVGKSIVTIMKLTVNSYIHHSGVIRCDTIAEFNVDSKAQYSA